jgi:crotonobetainyl-CoA:carnitine CoA-transferase CaiB-like acyl-CoA transferase
MSQPLAGVCVLDFSTLLPGPLATLLLAETGAEVIKIERPGQGRRNAQLPAEIRTFERELRAAQSRQALGRNRPQGAGRAGAAAAADSARRRRGRAIPPRCDGAAGPGLRSAGRDQPRATRAAVAQCIASRSAAAWRAAFAGKDVCCAIVVSVEEALTDAHFQARGLFARQLAAGGRAIAALPVPIDAVFRSDAARGYPELGEDNALLGG